ncbi:MAG: alpha,2-mannosyltransferase [Actinomycetota bacterium]|nr:alpha,2-mannosyltransferase [Actinomycetota bacterium]
MSSARRPDITGPDATDSGATGPDASARRWLSFVPFRSVTVPSLIWPALGVALLLGSAAPLINKYLIGFPDEIWQVDLEVYREGARSLVEGRPVYDWLTDNPQYLPFTYPPFAALVGTVLLIAPFGVVGWAWTVLQLALLWICTGIAFRPLLDRCGVRRGLAQGGVAALLVHLQPVQEGIRFGQVNAVLVTLCLVDVVRRRVGWWPRGSLTGIATAIKLTPGVFWIHYALARQWRVALISAGTAAAATVITFLVAPSATIVFWTDALIDPGRLGPNAHTQNQSLRGVLLRLGLEEGPRLSLIWLVTVVVVAGLGFRLALLLERAGEPVAVVGTLGMIAVLVSPVSWTHHYYWGVVALAAVLGDGRRTGRIVATVVGGAMLWFPLPWWGADWRSDGGWLGAAGFVVEQSDCWFALLALAGMAWFSVRDRRTI